MEKFPPLLAVSLESQGFNLFPWSLNDLVNEDMRDFRHGSMQGLIGFQSGEIVVIVLINKEPNNGQFVRTMDKLEEVARTFELDVGVVEIWNPKLMAHLISKRGYIKTGIDQVTKPCPQ